MTAREVLRIDEDLGAWFIAPAPLVAVKTAIYLSKLAEYGEELAAKDLTDVVELLRAGEGRAESILAAAPSAVVPTLPHLAERARSLTAVLVPGHRGATTAILGAKGTKLRMFQVIKVAAFAFRAAIAMRASYIWPPISPRRCASRSALHISDPVS